MSYETDAARDGAHLNDSALLKRPSNMKNLSYRPSASITCDSEGGASRKGCIMRTTLGD